MLLGKLVYLIRAVFTDYYISNYLDIRIYGVSMYLRMRNAILHSPMSATIGFFIFIFLLLLL
jgi:hypothetical protein